MPKLLNPAVAAALAAALASTTGYCVVTNDPAAPPAPALHSTPPVRLLPEVIEPYPLEALEAEDDAG